MELSDISTEEKIKNAARIVFHKKGFAASRTRDIAEEAGINLALLNYYFRSKEKLFNMVMLETLQKFFTLISSVFNDLNTSLDEKLEKFAFNYIDLLLEEPEIPMFIMSEIRNNPKVLMQKFSMNTAVFNSVFFRQYTEAVQSGRIKDQNFLHLMLNLIGMSAFPFIASPLIKEISGTNEEDYFNLLEERKWLIPEWIKSIIIK